ncbi:MAG: hypothetical protein AAF291_10940 [Pseudomonadota bacterium]
MHRDHKGYVDLTQRLSRSRKWIVARCRAAKTRIEHNQPGRVIEHHLLYGLGVHRIRQRWITGPMERDQARVLLEIAMPDIMKDVRLEFVDRIAQLASIGLGQLPYLKPFVGSFHKLIKLPLDIGNLSAAIEVRMGIGRRNEHADRFLGRRRSFSRRERIKPPHYIAALVCGEKRSVVFAVEQYLPRHPAELGRALRIQPDVKEVLIFLAPGGDTPGIALQQPIGVGEIFSTIALKE